MIFGVAVLAIYFLSVFWFLFQKTSVFGFGVHCGLRIFRCLTFGFQFS